jgi:hypothetical protein
MYASAITAIPAPDSVSPQNGIMSQQFITAHHLSKCAILGRTVSAIGNGRNGNIQIRVAP